MTLPPYTDEQWKFAVDNTTGKERVLMAIGWMECTGEEDKLANLVEATGYDEDEVLLHLKTLVAEDKIRPTSITPEGHHRHKEIT